MAPIVTYLPAEDGSGRIVMRTVYDDGTRLRPRPSPSASVARCPGPQGASSTRALAWDRHRQPHEGATMSTPEGGDRDRRWQGRRRTGYMNAEQREAFEEAIPELAAYSSLKFRVDDDDDEASEPTKALGAVSSTLKGASEEITRLRSEAEARELADGVERLLDAGEEVPTVCDWEEADELRRQVEVQALNHAVAIEDEELRRRTFAKLEERVDPDLYEQFATEWQAGVRRADRGRHPGRAGSGNRPRTRSS